MITFFIAAALSALLTPAVGRVAFRIGAVSVSSNVRWHQGSPIPRLAGVAIYLSTLVLAILAPWQWLVGLTLIFLAGLRDDIKPLPVAGKLVSQSISALLLIASIIPITEEVLFAIAALLWIVFFVNAYNMLDNMDGTAASTAVIISLSLALLAWDANDLQIGLLAYALAGAILGFLFFNISPARAFMGDCGSHFIGASMALLGLALYGEIGLVILLLYIVPILEFAYVTAKRLREGRRIYVGGRDHLAHDLHRCGLTERHISAIYAAATAIGGFAAWSTR